MTFDTDLFGRSVSIQIDTKVYSDLRMQFRVERSIKPRPNRVEVSIWNLSEETRKALVKDVYVAIEAGYQDNTSLIFRGNLTKVDHVRIGADWITTVRAGDGEKEIKKARVKFSSSAKMKPSEVLERVVGEITKTFKGESPGFDPKVTAGNVLTKAKQGDTKGAMKELSRGFVALGSAFDHAVRIANNMGYDLSIQDKELLLLGQNETFGDRAIILSPESGLEGSPEQVQDDHVKAKSRMNGRLRVGGEVVLDSYRFKQERFRIERADFFGDTHGPDWSVELTLKRLK